MTREIAVSYAQHGIRANAVSPGPLSGQMIAHLLDDSEGIALRTNSIPLRRLGLPRDVANAAVWLASDDAAYVTGIDLAVDGGLLARGL